jgi:predicted ATPase
MPVGGLLLIEEPEMGLHPDRQLQLLEALADMVSAGVTIVFTTHSPTMMLGLGSLVKEKRISSDRMAAYWVEKNAEGTSCSRLPMSEHGYIHGWVKSFAEVEQTLMKDWLTTLVKSE